MLARNLEHYGLGFRGLGVWGFRGLGLGVYGLGV